MRSPAPRWRAGNRAEVIRNKTSHTIDRTEPEARFGRDLSRPAVRSRHSLAHAIAALANVRRALG